MAVTPLAPAALGPPATGVRLVLKRLRGAAWLGWQIESNWAAPLTFAVYTLIRPIGTALILGGMYWAVGGAATRPELFAGFFVANALHEYVTRVLVGMGWVVVEEREDYETLKLVYTSPVGMRTYLAGRALVKFGLATFTATLVLALGWWLLGVRWSWGDVRWLELAAALLLTWTATLMLGFLVAGAALVLPRIAVGLNEGLAVGLYLLCGVIFPIDLLPHGLREISLALPFTYGYESVRRFLLGHGTSAMLERWSDLALLGALAATSAALAVAAWHGYGALERKARRDGRLDQTTLF